MKKLIFFVLIPLALAACQKAGAPPNKIVASKQDTIPDSAFFRLDLIKDSTNRFGIEEAVVHFNHIYHLSYNLANGEDAAPPPGYDPNFYIFVLTSDDIATLEVGVPYSAGVKVPLSFTAAGGPCVLKVSQQKKIPADIHIWCKDNYLKDSVDLQKGNYNFTIDKADTNSFGKKRFQIIVGPK